VLHICNTPHCSEAFMQHPWEGRVVQSRVQCPESRGKPVRRTKGGKAVWGCGSERVRGAYQTR
jgi:hypothetical protein